MSVDRRVVDPDTVEGEFTEVTQVPDDRAHLRPVAPQIELLSQEEDHRCALLTMDPEDPIWERLRGENLQWYARFRSWLMMEPGKRRYLAAYRAEYERHYPGKKAPRAIGASWFQAIRYFRWEERAQAWDQLQQAEAAEHARELLRSERADRIGTLKIARGRVMRRVSTMTDEQIERMAPSAAISLLLAINRELRTEQESSQVLKQIDAEDGQGNSFKAYFDIDLERV